MSGLHEEQLPVYYDPYNIDIVHDPYPVYARLREEAPIYYNERYDFWAISRHADVGESARRLEDLLQQPKRHPRTGQVEIRHATRRDDVRGPSHAHHVAGLDVRVFTPAGWRPSRTRSGSTACAAWIPTSAPTVSTSSPNSASMMPMRVIGMLLGIPEEDQIEVRDANDANLRTKPGAPMKVVTADAIADGADLRRVRRLARQEPLRRSDDRAAQCRVRRRERCDTAN